MQEYDFNFSEDTLLVEEENENTSGKRVRQSRRRRKSKMTSLEARRAVEELMLVKQYQLYDELYDY